MIARRGGGFSPSEIQRIRDDTRISDVVGRYVTWDRKKTNAGKGDFWACCPVHGEKNPSFHCEDQKGRFHCFGCGASGDVFKFLEVVGGLTFPQAVAELGGRAEESRIDPAVAARQKREREARIAKDKVEKARQNESVRDRAHRLWKESAPIEGTPAEAYLRSRGVDFAFSFPSLRFHPSMRHPEKGDRSPCLVAALQAPDDRFLGIWRIYLTDEGRKRPDVENEKLGLGAYSEAGGGVRLGAPRGDVNVVEGIETGFGVLGLTGGAPVLCGLNTTGMKTLIPPPDCGRFLIWPDGDVDKIRAIKRGDGPREERKILSPGIEAARTLRDRLEAEGFPVAIQPAPSRGRDFLDVYIASKKAFAE